MKKLILSTLGLVLLFSSCDNDDDSVSTPQNANLNLNLSGLEDLGSNYVYEGWIVVSGSPVSTGKFSINSSGLASQTSFSVLKSSLDAATAFVLTIEPAVGDLPEPTDIHVLAGDFSGTSGTLSVQHSAALGTNFSTSMGKYILATPTDSNMANEDSGVWFLDNSGATPVAGLNLPSLPSGWKYEGWVVLNGNPISTGTFSMPNGADSSGMFSGMIASPPFPGEDFLVNAPTGLVFPTSLLGKTVVISVEPSPDNSPAPFALKPLLQNVPSNAAVHTVLTMNQNLGTLPTGTFSR
jgi:hypothetical protein